MEFISCIRNLPRHFKSAVQNIFRNGVMSISSIFAMTLTLLLIAVISLTAVNLERISNNVEDSLTIYVKIDRALTDKEAKKIQPDIEAISGVSSVTFSSKDNELDKLISSQNKEGKKLFETYRKKNPLGCAYTVKLVDQQDIEKVADKISQIDNVNEVNYGGESTAKFIKLFENVRNYGSIGVLALVLLAIFLIVNTIQMAITSRHEEIEIMRMVGASNWYIRLPYMIEGMLLGIIGSVIPVCVVTIGYPMLYKSIVTVLPTMVSLVPPYPFVMYVSLCIVGLGMFVGLLGSSNAVRKYIKL